MTRRRHGLVGTDVRRTLKTDIGKGKEISGVSGDVGNVSLPDSKHPYFKAPAEQWIVSLHLL